MRHSRVLVRRVLRVGVTVAVSALMVTLPVARADAFPGDLDPGFGSEGKVTFDFAGQRDRGYGMVIQPDGKIVVAGQAIPGEGTEFGLIRYQPDGSLDATFGSGGTVTTNIGGIP